MHSGLSRFLPVTFAKRRPAAFIKLEINRASALLVLTGRGPVELPVLGLAGVQHRLVFFVAGKDIVFVAKLRRYRRPVRAVGGVPLLGVFNLQPDVFIVGGVLRPFGLERIDIFLHLRRIDIGMPLGGQYPEFENASAFEHSLEVARVVEPAPEGIIGVVGRHNFVNLVGAFGEFRFKSINRPGAFGRPRLRRFPAQRLSGLPTGSACAERQVLYYIFRLLHFAGPSIFRQPPPTRRIIPCIP